MVMVVTVHSVKSMKGSGDIAPLILNPYTILRRADSYPSARLTFEGTIMGQLF